MQRVKITKVYRGEQQTSVGMAQKVAIKTETHGEKWLSCFENKYNKKSLDSLAEGKEVELIIYPSGDYLNFKFPSETDYLKERVAKLEAHVFGTGASATVPSAPAYPEPDEDVPF